jgi:hypothetical protein
MSSTLKLEAAGAATVTSYHTKQGPIWLQRVFHEVVEEFRKIREERPKGLCRGIFKTALPYKEEQRLER